MTTEEIVEGASKPEVQLVGADGNAYAILGKCKAKGKEAGWTVAQQNAFFNEATSGDYDHLLQTAMQYCEVS